MTDFDVSDPAENQFPLELMPQLVECWPAPEASCWFVYGEGDGSRGKRVCPSWESMPQLCRPVLGWLAMQSPARLLDLPACIPDLTLYGAGLHDLGPGDSLGKHLDADVHALCGLRRLASSVLFVCNEWQPAWGGQLQFWDDAGQRIVEEVLPSPGRLIHFAATDDSWHSVAQVSCPPGLTRRTLSLFWYGTPTPPYAGRRQRALFA